MSVLTKWFKGPLDSAPPSKPVYSTEEKMNAAAADRGFAFDLIEQAEEALRDAAALEAAAVEESSRLAEQTVAMAEERAAAMRREADEVFNRGYAAGMAYHEQASQAADRSQSDESAVAALRRLVADEEAADAS